jgi:hypothetical protein
MPGRRGHGGSGRQRRRQEIAQLTVALLDIPAMFLGQRDEVAVHPGEH